MTPDPEELLEHVIDFLCEEQAEAVAELTDAEIARRAAIAIQRAQSHGFDQPEAITAFATLMFVVAPGFDRQPAIARALDNPKLTPAERIKQVFEKTSEADWDAAAANSQGWDDLE